NDIPAAGKRPQHKILRACLTQFKLNGVRITHVDLAYSRKEGCAWATEASGGCDDASIRGFDIFSSKITTVVKFHALAQEKRIGFAVFGNLPTMRQVWNDTLPTVPRVTPDQIVVHTALSAHIGDST